MSEKVETQEPEVLKVRVYNPSEVNMKDFKFKSAKQIEKKQAFKRAERILSFDDPECPEEPVNLLLSALTDNELAILYQNRSQLDASDVQSIR